MAKSHKTAVNHYLNGSNFCSIKKFAKFYFGGENVLSFRIAENRQYFIYLEENFFKNNNEAIKSFESWSNCNIRSIEK